MAFKTISLRAGSRQGQEQYSDEDRAAYQAKWDAFARFFARVREKGTRQVRGRVTAVHGPLYKEDRFAPGTYKRVFELTTELRQPGMEGLKFNVDVTASLNEKAKLNHLLAAVTGENPESATDWVDFHPPVLGTRDVLLVIKKGPQRVDNAAQQAKGLPLRRGGFYANVVEFEPIIEELDTPADPVDEAIWTYDEAEDIDPTPPAGPLGEQLAALVAPAGDFATEDEEEVPAWAA